MTKAFSLKFSMKALSFSACLNEKRGCAYFDTASLCFVLPQGNGVFVAVCRVYFTIFLPLRI